MTQQIIEKSLSEFDTLSLNSVFDVELIQGTENKIKIEGAQKIIENVTFSVNNNTLILQNNYKGNWLHPKKNKIKVQLTINKLSLINAWETCNIKTLNTLVSDELGLVLASKFNEATLDVNCTRFYYWNNFPCGGRLKLSGTTNQLDIWNVALMAIDAYDLHSHIVLVENASKGECKVSCYQSLVYKITGEGNIYLKGNPPLITKVEESSSGTLIIE